MSKEQAGFKRRGEKPDKGGLGRETDTRKVGAGYLEEIGVPHLHSEISRGCDEHACIPRVPIDGRDTVLVPGSVPAILVHKPNQS